MHNFIKTSNIIDTQGETRNKIMMKRQNDEISRKRSREEDILIQNKKLMKSKTDALDKGLDDELLSLYQQINVLKDGYINTRL